MGSEIFLVVLGLVVGFILLQTVGRDWLAVAGDARDAIKIVLVIGIPTLLLLLLLNGGLDPTETSRRLDAIIAGGAELTTERVRGAVVLMVGAPIAGIIIALIIKPLLKLLRE